MLKNLRSESNFKRLKIKNPIVAAITKHISPQP
jgi:hypothetical protein